MVAQVLHMLDAFGINLACIGEYKALARSCERLSVIPF